MEVKGFPPLQGNRTLQVQDLSQLPSTVHCSFWESDRSYPNVELFCPDLLCASLCLHLLLWTFPCPEQNRCAVPSVSPLSPANPSNLISSDARWTFKQSSYTMMVFALLQFVFSGKQDKTNQNCSDLCSRTGLFLTLNGRVSYTYLAKVGHDSFIGRG